MQYSSLVSGAEINPLTYVFQVLQLYQIAQIHHGLMMVGPSGSGKSSAWQVLLKALERVEGVEGVAHVIDPKVRFTGKQPWHTLVFISIQPLHIMTGSYFQPVY